VKLNRILAKTGVTKYFICKSERFWFLKKHPGEESFVEYYYKFFIDFLKKKKKKRKHIRWFIFSE
jgi:hypothetical protein